MAGCSFVGSSSLDLPAPAACTSDLGAYYLPRHYVTIALKRVPVSTSPDKWVDAQGRGAYALVKGSELARAGELSLSANVSANGGLIVTAQPDPEYGFCLDYLATLTSNDRLIVERDKFGLLERVTTKGHQYNNLPFTPDSDTDPTAGNAGANESTNASVLIAQRMTQAAFTGIARQPDCETDKPYPEGTALRLYCECRKRHPERPGQCAPLLTTERPLSRPPFQHRGDFADQRPADMEIRTPVFDTTVVPETPTAESPSRSVALNVDFDPTDPFEAAMFNHGLVDYDHCALLSDGKVDLKDAKRYCDNPKAYAQSRGFRPRAKPAASASREQATFRPYKGGVLYRARVSYPFYVFKRESGKWRLVHQQKVELANAGPIVSLGVDRAVFAKRNTVVEFNQGTLHKITINKQSELEAFAGIPLALVTSIVKLPTQVLMVKIDQTTDTTQLIAVNKAIIDAQVTYNDTLAKLQQAQAEVDAKGGVPGMLDPDRRTKLLQACEAVLGPQQGRDALETCRTIVDQSYNQ